MTTGDAIFYSALAVCALVLYLYTKDRWKWKRILLIVLALPIAVGVTIYIVNTIQNRPHKAKDFLGITLGDEKSDVIFKLGQHEQDGSWMKYKINDSHYIYVEYENDKVSAVFVDRSYTYANIQNISWYDNYNGIIEYFGQPTVVEKSSDDLARLLKYEKWGVFFLMSRDKIWYMGIYKNGDTFPFSLK